MIRLQISPAAFEAIAAPLPGNVGFENKRAPNGDWFIWLTALVSRLAPEQRNEVLPEALAAAKAIGSESSPALALAALVPHFAEQRDEVLREALAAAKATVDDETRARALVALIPHLAPDEIDQAIELTIDAVSLVSRSKALDILSIIANLSLEFESTAVVIEHIDAIKDVSRWYK